MSQLATITTKRQLTIPAKIYKKMGLSSGDKVLIETNGRELRIKKAVDLVEEFAGSVKIPKHLRGVDADKAIGIAKEKHFGETR